MTHVLLERSVITLKTAVSATRKLRHYFLEHPIVVVNEAPLSNILNNPEATDVCPFKE
jgi:hypothetical protein